jgi:hypothetical protein
VNVAVIAIVGSARTKLLRAVRVKFIRIEIASRPNTSRIEVKFFRVEQWIGLEWFAARQSLLTICPLAIELSIELVAAAVFNFPLLPCLEK